MEVAIQCVPKLHSVVLLSLVETCSSSFAQYCLGIIFMLVHCGVCGSLLAVCLICVPIRHRQYDPVDCFGLIRMFQ